MILILSLIVAVCVVGVIGYGVWVRVQRERNIRNLIRKRYGPHGTH